MDDTPGVDDARVAPPSAQSPAAPHQSSSLSPLTAEARALVEKATQGGVPLYTTTNLARIAEENGVSVSPEMTPNQIIDELRRRATPGDA